MKSKFIDFQHIPVGTLVKRSDHWCKQNGVKKTRIPKKLGIIVGHTFYNQDGRIVTYPTIHWEGAIFPSLTHPMNVAIYRKYNPEYIEVDENQPMTK